MVRRTDPDGLGRPGSGTTTTASSPRPIATASRTTYAYDGDHRRPSWITGPDGATIAITVDETDLPVEMVDADGVATRFEHDDDGQLAAMVDGLGQPHRASATTPPGMPIEIVDAAGGVTTLVNDDAGRIVESVIGDDATRFAYTAAGRPAVGRRPGRPVVVGHVRRQRPDATPSPTAKDPTVGFEWDLFGNLETVVAPDGGRFGHVYDKANNLVGGVRPRGQHGRTRARRRGPGRRGRSTPPDGSGDASSTCSAAPSCRSLPTAPAPATSTTSTGPWPAWSHPDGTSVSAEVDVAGRVIAVVDETRARYEFEYTPAGRLAGVAGRRAGSSGGVRRRRAGHRHRRRRRDASSSSSTRWAGSSPRDDAEGRVRVRALAPTATCSGISDRRGARLGRARRRRTRRRGRSTARASAPTTSGTVGASWSRPPIRPV